MTFSFFRVWGQKSIIFPHSQLSPHALWVDLDYSLPWSTFCNYAHVCWWYSKLSGRLTLFSVPSSGAPSRTPTVGTLPGIHLTMTLEPPKKINAKEEKESIQVSHVKKVRIGSIIFCQLDESSLICHTPENSLKIVSSKSQADYGQNGMRGEGGVRCWLYRAIQQQVYFILEFFFFSIT